MRQGEDASRTQKALDGRSRPANARYSRPGARRPPFPKVQKIHTHKHTHAHTHIYILELAYRMRDHPKETIRVVHRRGERKP
jgi:hypothetical protein